MKTFELDITKIQERGRPIFLNAHGTFETLRVPLFGATAADIDEILNCEYQGSLRAMFIRSKVIQILCSLVSQINAHGAGTRLLLPQGFKTRSIEAAAKIYKHELRKPPTIEELANRIGIDRRELTKGFQELFGTTPRGYQLQQRMEHAELLLQEGGKSISEIGRIVGYQGYRTFVRAYQTFYDRPPVPNSKKKN
jgi:AraC-like DNA-binding protein